jgi:putative selenate reductase
MTSDRFWGSPIETLLKWILAAEKQGDIFGIRKELFFIPSMNDPFRMRRYGQLLETPLGVAAGPHTQLSQNLIAAWLTGARYMELKTVQILDELDVTKPCIDMTDEGYNCEWSQELKLDRSFDEYLNAWIVLHILKDKFGWGATDEAGFIFNMSVGYNLEGILSPPVQQFLDRMADCAQAKKEKIERLARFYPRVKDLNIPDRVSDNITISTMHGCPPDEVEKIGHYFVTERKLNTTIKLNPTLLGPERLRSILNDKLGFETVVPDLAFEHDLKYADGVALIRSLLEAADDGGVAFNIKLTNTLETSNLEQNLPKSEQMVYMSGRALHPISINLAARLQAEFDGHLDISFSAGTDCFNIAEVLACNLKPVTVCSDLLKPGGYGRLSQYLEAIGGAMKAAKAGSLEDFILSPHRAADDTAKAGLQNLSIYAETVVQQEAYRKARFPYDNIKTSRPLSTFDCIHSPCTATCPASQDIPGYLYHTARGEYEKAFQVILKTNPFPHVQGMVCDHLCQEKCTRMNYDNPLLIREIKRFIAQKFERPIGLEPAAPNGKKVAIVGAGPSGLACAHFLALDGFEVHIYERKPFAGGWASDAIPEFRLDAGSVQKDIDGIVSLGVEIHTDNAIDAEKFRALRETHDYVYIAVGAQEGVSLGIPGEDAEGVLDQLAFLSAVRQGERPDLGKTVAVIGGGNSAMDAARTAKRLVGTEGTVSVLYRRTRREMPAAPEEVQALFDEGIELVELTAPECMLVENGRVTSNVCFRMELGEKDASGRPKPIRIDGSEFELNVDSVISAIGQRVNVDFFPEDKLEIDPATHETQLTNVFAGGDAVRGASTLIRAIGDGKKVAESIKTRTLSDAPTMSSGTKKTMALGELHKKRARRQFGRALPEIAVDARRGFDLVIETLDEESAREEAARCLYCDEVCNVCVTVCPNRANAGFQMAPVTYTVQEAQQVDGQIQLRDVETVRIAQSHQVLNLADYCNECGNCATFCPTSGAPYRDKAKFHIMRRSFEASDSGYHFVSKDELLWKSGDQHRRLTRTEKGLMFDGDEIKAAIDPDNYALKVVEIRVGDAIPVNTKPVMEMAALYNVLKDQLPFTL